MDIAYCNEYLTESIKSFLFSWVAHIVVMIVIIFVTWIVRIIAKYKLPKRKLRNGILLIILYIVVVSYSIFSSYAIPAAKDLKNEDYIAVHGTFERYSVRNKGLVSSVSCGIIPDGQDKAIPLTLVTKNYWNREKFPVREELTGTVIYANKSKFILDFIPDS